MLLISFPFCTNFLIISAILSTLLDKLPENNLSIWVDSESDFLKYSSKNLVSKKLKILILATSTLIA